MKRSIRPLRIVTAFVVTAFAMSAAPTVEAAKLDIRKNRVISTAKLCKSSIQPGEMQAGTASWYGPNFHGRATANGERYDMNKLTAAHKTWPPNTWVRVTNVRNGESVVLRINDRGPFAGDRVIDLSLAAAKAIDIKDSGVSKVNVEVVCSPGTREKMVIPPRKPQIG